MRRREHWTATADRVNGSDLQLIGEDDNGDLYAPSRTRADWWDERLNLRRPRHLYYWLRSRLSRQIVWLEPYP